METPVMNANALLEQINRASGKRFEEPIPAGFKTVKEWGNAWSISRWAAERACKKGAELGLMELRIVRRYTGNRVAPISFYKPTGKKVG